MFFLSTKEMSFLNNVQFFSSNERQIKQASVQQQQNQQAADEKQSNRSSILYNEKYEMKLEKSNILMLGPTGKYLKTIKQMHLII